MFIKNNPPTDTYKIEEDEFARVMIFVGIIKSNKWGIFTVLALLSSILAIVLPTSPSSTIQINNNFNSRAIITTQQQQQNFDTRIENTKIASIKQQTPACINDLSNIVTNEVYPYVCLLNYAAAILDYDVTYFAIPENIDVIAPLTFAILIQRRSPTNVGPLPTTIGKLSGLKFFVLDTFPVHSMPSEIGQLTNLVYLDFANSNIKGSIPSELGNLSILEHLGFRNNGFSGVLPTTLSRLTSLRSWRITEDIGGNMLELAVNMTQLNAISPASPYFTGTIPSEFGLLTTMTLLRMDINSFSGTIPSEISSLSLLKQAYFGDNNLSGCIPSQLGLLSNIDYLQFNNNKFECTIPKEISELSILIGFEIESNSIFGTIMTEFGLLTQLTVLNIGSNLISGTIPTEIMLLKELKKLELNLNLISGSLPSQIGNLIYLDTLDISLNKISGQIPEQFSNLSKMEKLILNENKFYGLIKIENFQFLKFIDLSDNSFIVTIPSEITQLSFLESIIISNCGLYGTLPTEIGTLKYIQVIDFSQNPKLNGKAPTELLNIIPLKYLNLSYTKLFGSLNLNFAYNCQFSKIQGCPFTCNSCPFSAIKASDCVSVDNLDPVCISILDLFIAYGSVLISCVLVLIYFSPHYSTRGRKIKESIILAFSLISLLSNGLFIWSSEGLILQLSFVCITLVGVSRISVAGIVLSKRVLNNPNFQKSNILLKIVAGVVCILSPHSSLYIANCPNISIQVKIIISQTVSVLAFQDVPQVMFQLYTVFVGSTKTITLFALIISCFSLLLQVCGLAIATTVAYQQKDEFQRLAHQMELKEKFKQSKFHPPNQLFSMSKALYGLEERSSKRSTKAIVNLVVDDNDLAQQSIKVDNENALPNILRQETVISQEEEKNEEVLGL
eukprot:c20422_g1_i2.p1 GENE.c20422_g1_i2~~c20422_g1_i2.p1  ORF type:complete len:899 (+),score=272.49 c20422_g1_i2:41-2737(+)